MSWKVISLVAAAAIIAPQALADHLRIATEGAFAPWNATDTSGHPIGFEVDLAQDLCRRLAADCEIVAQDWDGLIPALRQGKFDAIMAAMSATAERRKALAFSLPYAVSATVVAVAPSGPLTRAVATGGRVDLSSGAAPDIEALARTLRGRTIGAQIGTIQARFIEADLGLAATTYQRFADAALDLRAGRIDALVADRGALATGAPDLSVIGPDFVGGRLGDGTAVGLRQADTDLKRRFDDAIRAARGDGTIARLSNQWFGLDLTPWSDQ